MAIESSTEPISPPGVPARRDSVSPAAQAEKELTPAMRQYVEQKERVGDAILLFRMGDFYETFYDDAVLCSKVLGIALTSRDKNSARPVPLAGIPYHALDAYLKKLIAAGHRVAISEQMEDPREAQGVVKRDIVRIVTAGTLTDEALLPEGDANILAALCIRGSDAGCALVDLAGGRFEVFEAGSAGIVDELVRHHPAELLIDDERGGEAETVAGRVRQLCSSAVTRRPAHEFSTYQAEKTLYEHFGVCTLAGFGFEKMNPSLCAAGSVLQYLQETQKTALGHIDTLRRRASDDRVQVDHCTWRSLEIERTLRSGQREGTLLHAIDRTVHPIGGRRLRAWLRAPLVNAGEITTRQDAVALLVDQHGLRGRLRARLRLMTDVERITGRVALARTTPRDLSALARTLNTLPAVAEELRDCPSALLTEIARGFLGLTDMAEFLGKAIQHDVPGSIREGGFIADGYDPELDRLRAISRDGQSWLGEFQRREVERTGIATLKVGFNRVFGYYLEVSHAARGQVPPDYVRRQTIKNAERYITDELKRHESEVLTARERANELEANLFERVRAKVAENIPALMRVADALGTLDCLAGLAELAVQRRYVRPELMETGLDIREGRHPVLDQTLGDAFVPNDALMADASSRVMVITGPNMAGKSTYIRQAALLTLLAHTGSFVPARSMHFALTDRIFARVGAADEIMHGQSTFMVEMTEAANILHHATERSLVVLDELGRGTSTFDGLSLAWAITEYLARKSKCLALIATHYHEMTRLAELLPGVRNYHAAVREVASADLRHSGEEGLVFLHRIMEGAASKSYGIHVARLAGIPQPVLARSREVLAELQARFEREPRMSPTSAPKPGDAAQMALFPQPIQAPPD